MDEFIIWFENLIAENTVEPSFQTIWEIWEKLYEVLTTIVTLIYLPLGTIIDGAVESLFGIQFNTPATIGTLCIADFFSVSLLATIIIFGIVAFVYKTVKDIINPFN